MLKTEYDLAKAKSDFIEIMRELSTFQDDFMSLRKRLLLVKKACVNLREQKVVSKKQLQNKKLFLNNIRERYDKVKEEEEFEIKSDEERKIDRSLETDLVKKKQILIEKVDSLLWNYM